MTSAAQRPRRFTHVLVTGGAGYVGSALVPQLLAAGYSVTVLDLYLYGTELFAAHRGPRLREVVGDIRDPKAVADAMEGVDAVIHLACISNDPSYDLDPALGRSINYDAFRPLVQAAKAAGVKRFVYASSSSVYGVKAERDVHELLPLEPLTDYSKYKALCEEVLAEERAPGFVTVTVRPSTVCGWAPRLRLDLVVNILSAHAWFNRKIRVLGGAQMRPNIHIADMVRVYLDLLTQPDELIDGEIFNAGCENRTVAELASLVQDNVAGDIGVEIVPTNDNRSYHVSAEKMQRVLGFTTEHTIADAIVGLCEAFADGRVAAMNDPLYHNITRMQQVALR
jgi:nucleoside-diphosphate-sugar epimerase